MTTINKQMYDDFQLVYNNLASNLAPGLDTFEISMYLTKAYYTFVSQTYNQYESNEGSRKALAPLVSTAKLTASSIANAPEYRIVKESVFFELPKDLLYIVYEAIDMDDSSDTTACLRGKTISVIPVLHDEFHQVYRNPFKYTNKRALRLDVDIPDIGIVSEIVAKDSHIKDYFIRYIRKPKPIILETLTGNDYIEGQQTESECELNTVLHQSIVRLAAQMAYQDYKAA